MTTTERNEEIREFVLSHYPPAHQWAPKTVEDWTSWAADKGFLYLCYDEPGSKGKLVGLTIARPLSIDRGAGVAEVADTDYDLDGQIVYVDLTISTAGRKVMQAMMLAILKRMAGKPVLVFRRLKTKDKFKVHALKDFANRLLGRT